MTARKMTVAQAREEAQRRWGKEASAEALRVGKEYVPGVGRKVIFRYVVGFPGLFRQGYYNGKGDSYEAAFLDADRQDQETWDKATPEQRAKMVLHDTRGRWEKCRKLAP